MGKGILIVVAAAIIGGAMMMYNSQQMTQEMDATLSTGHESQVLARELARSGMNVAVGKAHREWDTAVNTIESHLASIEQEGGSYATSAMQQSPTAIDLEVTSTFGDKNYRIKKSLVLAGPLDAAFVVDGANAVPTVRWKWPGIQIVLCTR